MTFDEYLISKKIDAKSFRASEPELYESWDMEFVQMHPNSFTAQKLYLINPIRLKYTLILKPEDLTLRQNVSAVKEDTSTTLSDNQTQIAKSSEVTPGAALPQIPKAPRPVFKPKPKTN